LAKTFIYVILLLTGVNFCILQGQTPKKTNLEVLEQDISGELEKFLYYPDLNRDIQFVFYVTSVSKDKNEKKFIESVIKKTADKNRLKISFSKDEQMLSSDSVYNKVNIGIVKLKTDYTKFVKNQFLGDKSMQRVVTSELSVEITTNSNTLSVKDSILTGYKDEIPYENFEEFESGEYHFTQSIPPGISWLETIIFPAVIITVSAVAAILFFTIRSK
jgi:hypothetical protein